MLHAPACKPLKNSLLHQLQMGLMNFPRSKQFPHREPQLTSKEAPNEFWGWESQHGPGGDSPSQTHLRAQANSPTRSGTKHEEKGINAEFTYLNGEEKKKKLTEVLLAESRILCQQETPWLPSHQDPVLARHNIWDGKGDGCTPSTLPQVEVLLVCYSRRCFTSHTTTCLGFISLLCRAQTPSLEQRCSWHTPTLPKTQQPRGHSTTLLPPATPTASMSIRMVISM